MSGMKNQVNRVVSLNRLPVRQLRLLKQIGRLADEQGMSVYLVGGVVRDLLLKRENWDLDLTIEGDGIAFARLVADRYKAGLAVFDRFATARLVFPDGLKVDIATTRRESYAQPADLPTVQPASIEEDLSRRDFTINAIAVQLNQRQFGRLLDPYAGQRDLRARTIRVLHAGSFQDDPTRIFRAIRFEQRFGFHLERTTLRLLAQAASTNLIQQLSGPRLQNEILLLLAERDPARAISRLAQLKLFRFLPRSLSYTKNVKRTVTAVPKALAWWARRFPDSAIDRPIVYLMALSSEASQAVVATMIRRLALSREQAKKVSTGRRRVDRALKRLTDRKIARPSQAYRLLEDFSNEALVLLLAKQVSMQQGVRLSLLRRRLVAYMKNRTTKTALTGRDLQAMGLQPGPQYKTILGKLLDARIDGVVTTEADERALAHRLLKKSVLVIRER
ncbi:MAG: CCA tRNA nucleotidyltransferase [Nitrospira sp.]|nr:CCA tRNA nucleotidyltransferase [Nitrospira sp.]TKB71810.1 MAG: CCA tRNA nucleotidyltransferase [Nitrospira sp.]